VTPARRLARNIRGQVEQHVLSDGEGFEIIEALAPLREAASSGHASTRR